MSTKYNGFMWVQPQIVGSPDDWDYTYKTGDSACHESLKQAFDDGFEQLDHDDFVIAEWKNDKIIAIYAGPAKSDIRADLLDDYGNGIMQEFGLAA